MDDFEAVAMLGLELLEFFLEEYISRADVAEQKFELGLVLGLSKCVVQNLRV